MFEHGPGHDRDLSPQGDGGFLLASLLAAMDPIVGSPGPGVVAEADPGALQKHGSQQA